MRPILALALVLCGCPKAEPPGPADAAPAVSVVFVEKPCPTSSVANVPLPPAPLDAGSAAPENLYTRQVRTLRVGDVDETWILRWRGKPAADCVDEHWLTCPCAGFAYGERGALELARLRPHEAEDVFVFRQHTEEDPSLQRWIPGKDDASDKAPTAAHLKTLDTFDAMQLADYDHDGQATEFVFRVGVGAACGHDAWFKVVGVSKKNPKLHFFDLTLPHSDNWEKVKNMPMPGELKIVSWQCGDHGTETEESLLVTLDKQGNFKSQEKSRKCGPND